MNLSNRVFTIILILALIGVLIWKFASPKNESSRSIGKQEAFYGVDADPRMKLCKSATEADNSDIEAIKALALENPLTLPEKDKAIYRVSVLRKSGLPSTSVLIETPKAKVPGIAKVEIFLGNKGVATAKEEAQLTLYQANNIINIFERARIWGEPKLTYKQTGFEGSASVVIEIVAPNAKRCVTSRYDDERVRPIMREIFANVSPMLKTLNLKSFTPPEQQIFGKEYAPDK